MNYYGYEVDSKFVDTSKGCLEWVKTGNGENILGTKGGNIFCIDSSHFFILFS